MRGGEVVEKGLRFLMNLDVVVVSLERGEKTEVEER